MDEIDMSLLLDAIEKQTEEIRKASELVATAIQVDGRKTRMTMEKKECE